MAELIREAALEGVRDELPHSLAVVIEDVLPREDNDDLLDVHALLYVETPQPEAIIIGRAVRVSRRSAPNARKQIRTYLGPASTCTCMSRWPRTGSRDPNSWQLGSDRRVAAVVGPLAAGGGSSPPPARAVPISGAPERRDSGRA